MLKSKPITGKSQHGFRDARTTSKGSPIGIPMHGDPGEMTADARGTARSRKTHRGSRHYGKASGSMPNIQH